MIRLSKGTEINNIVDPFQQIDFQYRQRMRDKTANLTRDKVADFKTVQNRRLVKIKIADFVLSMRKKATKQLNNY